MSDPAPRLDPDETGLPLHPTDILINVIVVLLTPMFLMGGNQNLELAQFAALETVNSFRIRNQAELIVVAQIIAFGLTALGSLSLSMDDEIPLPTLLRLRNNAVALNQAEQRQRRILAEPRPQPRAEPRPVPQPRPEPACQAPAPQAAAPAPTVTQEDAQAFAAINAFIQGTTDTIPLPPMGMRAAGPLPVPRSVPKRE